MTSNTRQERDTFGPIDVPADRLWGAQTQRSLLNFDISGERQPRELIHALAQVTRASARVNHGLGLLEARTQAAIVAAPEQAVMHKDGVGLGRNRRFNQGATGRDA